MTTTYDPEHPSYLDEADVRMETARVFDLCIACRACVDLCEVFPAMFHFADGGVLVDAGHFTPSQQDRVIDHCHHCSACAVSCPYLPGISESALDFPRLVNRQLAMRLATGQISMWRRARVWIAVRRRETL